MIKLTVRITLLILLALSSCVTMPDEHLTVSQRGDMISIHDARDCDINQFENILKSAQSQQAGLDSRGFKILTWNVLRGEKEQWEEDFNRLIMSKDILTIQEARLTDDMRELLEKGHFNWDISTAFKYMGADVGVLTASRPEPFFTCTLRIKEPLISIPKTSMVTLYPLSNTDKSLMVVNIHSINFTLGTGSFYRQLEKIEKILSRHHGPVIFSGDVNTWSRKRMTILKDFSARLGLKAVTFDKHNRTRVFGRDIDHIYYRQLTVTDAKIIKVSSSDHNPMIVSFRLE
jgi:endonuclease/exonuclease/phosphatase (EEP) superfamily protein YafD